MAVSIEAIDALFADTLLGVNAIADALKLDAYEVAVYLKMRYTPDQLVERGRKVLAAQPDIVGEYHERFGEVTVSEGYKRVRKPKWYRGSANSRHVALHTLLVCEAQKLFFMPRDSVVIHLDGDKQNNDLDNLQMVTRSEATNIYKRRKRNER